MPIAQSILTLTGTPSAPIHDIRFEGIMTHNWTDDTHLKPHNPGPTKVFGPNFLALKTLPPEALAVISNAGADAPDNSTDPCAP